MQDLHFPHIKEIVVLREKSYDICLTLLSTPDKMKFHFPRKSSNFSQANISIFAT